MAEEALEACYEIRDSEIHGRGLYATMRIPVGSWIVEYVGEKIDKDESERRSTALIEKNRHNGEAKVYTFVLDDEWDIDGNCEANDARLMNHSCEPNVEAQVWDAQEIWFVAIKDIELGEELVFNYGFDLDNWQDHHCCCGAACCVGYIAGEEYWPELLELQQQAQEDLA